ncbi:MAG: hypothetical protein M0D55_16080 [Elusimicrobiota bacterium]|nr:MAG: hypothetical protein M0D55_16080 [Elusimicrobiota bacterium]
MPITDLLPWSSGDDGHIENFLERTCEEISESTGTLMRVESGHYGCGYASFVDAWFYKKAPEFAFPKVWAGKPVSGMDDVYFGLTVFLSRLSPYFVLMEVGKALAEVAPWEHSGTVPVVVEN